MPRSTTSADTEHRPRLIAAVGSSRKRLIASVTLALVLIVELVAGSSVLSSLRASGSSVLSSLRASGSSSLSSLRASGSSLPSPPSPPPHTMTLVDRGGPAALRGRIAAEMPGAVDAVTAFWGDHWAREIVVVTTGDDAEFAAQTTQPGRGWTDVAAVALADRIVFAPRANSMSDASLRIVLRHELFHYAARSGAAVGAPRWLLEGVADYVARPPGPRPGPDVVPARLPSDAELDAGGKQGSAAYDRAWWFARFVADEYGPAGLKRLYVEGSAPAALGVGLPELVTRWQGWLAPETGPP